jgi:hypothetical protein
MIASISTFNQSHMKASPNLHLKKSYDDPDLMTGNRHSSQNIRNEAEEEMHSVQNKLTLLKRSGGKNGQSLIKLTPLPPAKHLPPPRFRKPPISKVQLIAEQSPQIPTPKIELSSMPSPEKAAK